MKPPPRTNPAKVIRNRLATSTARLDGAPTEATTVTHRNVAPAFTVISGHLHGDSDPYDWQALAASPTLVILMGLRNLSEITFRLIAAGKPTDTPVAVIQSGTADDQRTMRGPLETIAERACNLDPPAVIVIGPVAAYHDQLAWFNSVHAAAGSAGVAT